MAARLSTEERLNNLDARMTSVEQLREEMRAGHVMIVTALTEQIAESRRYTLVLHEDVLDRIRVISEGLAAQNETLASQDQRLASQDQKLARLDERLAWQGERLDTHDLKLASIDERLASHDEKFASHAEKVDALSEKIDAARGETRLMFEQIVARLDAPRTPPKRKRP